MSYEIAREFRFEAAHRLPNAPSGHKARRLHGHSFRVELWLCGELKEPEGWACDFAEVAGAWRQVHEALDHRYLNEIGGLENPTSEHLAAWIWQWIAPILPDLSAVVVAETCTAKCVFRGP